MASASPGLIMVSVALAYMGMPRTLVPESMPPSSRAWSTSPGHSRKAAGSFKIDHPLDPDDRWLHHSFVEGPDMMNVYNGNVGLDANGEAWVDAPRVVRGTQSSCRYQLTALGAPGPISTWRRRCRVTSWGYRQSPAAACRGRSRVFGRTPGRTHHRIAVDEDKPASERGSFLHPKEHGQPDSALPLGLTVRSGRPQAPVK